MPPLDRKLLEWNPGAPQRPPGGAILAAKRGCSQIKKDASF